MTEKTSITVAGDWAKPAQVLIEKISEAVGGTLRPWQTERVARAEAKAALIKTESDIKASELLEIAGMGNSPLGDRAIKRMIAGEVRKQINIEEVAHKALEKLKADAKPEELDPDFVSDLLEKASNTSDEDIQSIWASILAGEANTPGTFSKRTLSLAASLDKRDADLFTRFCSSCWRFEEVIALVSDESQKALARNGVTFTDLVHLEALGLIRFDPSGGFVQNFDHTGPYPVRLVAHYFGTQVILQFTSEPNQIDIGHVLLTSTGTQLALICGAQPSLELLEAGVADLIADNVSAYSTWPKDGSQ